MDSKKRKLATPSRKPLKTVQSVQRPRGAPTKRPVVQRAGRQIAKRARRNEAEHEAENVFARESVHKRYEEMIAQKDERIRSLESTVQELNQRLVHETADGSIQGPLENTDSSPSSHSDLSSDECDEQSSSVPSTVQDPVSELVHDSIQSALSEVNIELAQQNYQQGQRDCTQLLDNAIQRIDQHLVQRSTDGCCDVPNQASGAELAMSRSLIRHTPPRCFNTGISMASSSTMTTPPPVRRSVATWITPARNRCVEGDAVGPPALIEDSTIGPQLAVEELRIQLDQMSLSEDALRLQNDRLQRERIALKETIYNLEQDLEKENKNGQDLCKRVERFQKKLSEYSDLHRCLEKEKLQLQRQNASMREEIVSKRGQKEKDDLKDKLEKIERICKKKDEELHSLNKTHKMTLLENEEMNKLVKEKEEELDSMKENHKITLLGNQEMGQLLKEKDEALHFLKNAAYTAMLEKEKEVSELEDKILLLEKDNKEQQEKLIKQDKKIQEGHKTFIEYSLFRKEAASQELQSKELNEFLEDERRNLEVMNKDFEKQLSEVHVELIQTQADLESKRNELQSFQLEFEKLRCDVSSEVEQIRILVDPLCEMCLKSESCQVKKLDQTLQQDVCRNLCKEFENEERTPAPASSLVAQALAALNQNDQHKEDGSPECAASCPMNYAQEEDSSEDPSPAGAKDSVVEKIHQVSEMLRLVAKVGSFCPFDEQAHAVIERLQKEKVDLKESMDKMQDGLSVSQKKEVKLQKQLMEMSQQLSEIKTHMETLKDSKESLERDLCKYIERESKQMKLLAEFEKGRQELNKEKREAELLREQIQDLLKRVETYEFERGASACSSAPQRDLSVTGLLREKLSLERKVSELRAKLIAWDEDSRTYFSDYRESVENKIAILEGNWSSAEQEVSWQSSLINDIRQVLRNNLDAISNSEELQILLRCLEDDDKPEVC